MTLISCRLWERLLRGAYLMLYPEQALFYNTGALYFDFDILAQRFDMHAAGVLLHVPNSLGTLYGTTFQTVVFDIG